MYSKAEKDIQLTWLQKYMTINSIYKYERYWFYFQTTGEIILPLSIFIYLTYNIHTTTAIILSSIPSILFILISNLIFSVFNPISFLIIIGFCFQILFNYTLTQPSQYPCHHNWILGLLGLIILASSYLKKNLTFFILQSWKTKNIPDKLVEWRNQIQFEEFRVKIRLTNIIVGIFLIIQAFIITIIYFLVKVEVLTVVCPILSTIFGAGSLCTVIYAFVAIPVVPISGVVNMWYSC